jgi:hypothetical protein
MFVFRIYAVKNCTRYVRKGIPMYRYSVHVCGSVLGVGRHLSLKHTLCKGSPNIKTVVNSMYPELVPHVSKVYSKHTYYTMRVVQLF